MTMIDVDTSPLQAAREWRGIGLVAAAMTSGLPMSQAEALEEGDPSAFGTVDEMIAAAVVYGASLGIGRDEAVALLDRTVCRTGAQVQLPEPAERPNAEFSGAVQSRSARMAGSSVSTTPLTTDDEVAELEEKFELDDLAPLEPASSYAVDPMVGDSVPSSAFERELPQGPHGPTPEQAVAASGEIHLDDSFGPEAPWERSGHTSELEAWAEDLRDADEDAVAAERPGRAGGLAVRVTEGTHAAIERVLGTEKADATREWLTATGERVRELTRDARDRLRRSEHATLIVAIGAGAVLIAIVVALGGALDGEEPKGGASSDRAATAPAEAPAQDPAPTVPAADAAAPVAAKPGPMIAPAKLTLDIFNAGSKKGYAKEVAAELDAAGYRIGEVTNAKSDYPGATIIHPADMAREAKVLARRTGISTLQEAPGTTRRITIVVT